MINLKSFSAIKLAGSRTMGRSVLVLRKHSPEILTTVGVVSVVASAVLASRATLKLDPTLEEMRNTLAYTKGKRDIKPLEEYPEVEFQKDMVRSYVVGTKNIAKLYAPAVTLGLASIGCIIGAHGIMRKRNVAMAAAYKAVETSFSEYRKRVVEELGEDQERDIRLGLREEEVIGEDGKKTIVKVSDTDARLGSPYTKFFDELNPDWKNNSEANLNRLRCEQNYANDLLRARGHVFLNEVYERLNIPKTQAGQIVGWFLNKDGDNFVDFGLYDIKNENAREFVNGFEKAIRLDFNVDGPIFDFLEK